MLARKLMIALCAAAASTALAQTAAPSAAAQKPTAAPAQPQAAASKGVPEGGEPTYLRPETAQQRKDRLGTAEDPGTNPDPAKHFWRFGKSYHIERYDRRWANYEDVEEGMVRPFAFVNVQKELYQQNDKYVWVWIQDVTQDEVNAMMAAPSATRFTDEQIKYYKTIRSEFFETTPKQTETVVRFEESSEGLPTAGSWRNSGTVADMNGDGCPDIIAPPERAGGNFPVIFLGDCKGHWKYWSDVKWPRSVDYGSVVAADFNKDGKMDLAFGVHLTGVYVFLGDGKGNFTDHSEGLPTAFPTRRVIVTDVDGDGWPDVVGISEGPTSARKPAPSEASGRVRAFLNRDHGKRWESATVAPGEAHVGGDWLSAGNFNGDKRPDFIGASIFFNGTENIYLSDAANKMAWKPLRDDQGTVIPGASYYYASAVGKFSAKDRDDAIISYIRFWPTDLEDNIVPTPPAKSIVGIDRLSFTGGLAKRTSIARWGDNRAVWGLAAGDFNRDGKLDFMYTRFDPREVVLMLGDGKGGFTSAKVEGIAVAPNTNYDLLVADVNNDGLPDVILMYESSGKTAFAQRDGSIHVFLNRGAVKAAPGQKTASAK